MPTSTKAIPMSALVLSLASAAAAACGASGDGPPTGGGAPPETTAQRQEAISWGTLPPPGPTTPDTPVGLALDLEDGVSAPMKVRKSQRFYINQIDLRAHVTATVDEGVAGLDAAGDFASLDWRNTERVDESFVAQLNADGTATRRRFYRKARWMDQPSLFVVEQLDVHGAPSGAPVVVDTGLEYLRTPVDSFFTRRLRAIQWAYDCASKTDCSTAKNFMEEALVELRYAEGPNPSFKLDAKTTQLRVVWSAKPASPYLIPIEQVENPTWDYGFGIDLVALTPPAPDGTYAPGQQLQFQFTLRDGSGKPLHPPGQLPTFLDYLTGNDPAGIDYWNVFETTMTYYRRKHKEKQMLVALQGPMQDNTTIHDVVDFAGEIFSSTDGAVVTARPSQQGFFAAAAAVPSWLTLIGVAPANGPVGDTVTFTLPADAKPGTYSVVMKARRSYMGEELPRAKTIHIQVGTPTPTHKTFTTGNCQSCHAGGSDLTRVGHAISITDRDTCTTCHGPLPFEPEGPVYVRSHFIHSRTDRLSAPLTECKTCHLDRQGIERTSKSACMSCHKSYPQSHVQQFGPIVDMYIGGTINDSFSQCSTTCHTNHPQSGL